MKNHFYSLICVLFAVLIFGFFAESALAQDPTIIDSTHYKVEFENEQVRVVRITYGPGEKSVMHEHPDGVEVFLTDQNVKFTYPDGKTEEITAKAGETNWAPGVKQHLPENIGDEPLELILVEMKVKSQTAK